ncbi:DNA mismatch repair protein MutS [Meiothermus granaticius]|uniref:DNA mismatch repair protein MutS n=1 Tax=Meiothermus granaticius NBRC 107808 TaxID=1227551 RepID=A0A399FCI4_9DEIN|nr:DNA mismatch repair protein MutS [Meiothermus granaticius]RIH93435.1 DNA mismatch repair protein MutS [Meiothermus granaticius NBRC 107808]GEM87683.1 DNA mismatch repair protein MutS [Meiothermus granaticius NBRC 107808]
MNLKGQGAGPLPPLLQQYVELRDAYPDYLLLFQVGDFYETFGEDAERLSKATGIFLTHKTSKDFTTPMAGIPVRSGDTYLERLLKLGFRVAVAEQMELATDTEGLVRREVTQLLTPGTILQENLLRPEANYLAALATGDGYGLALLDVSTGEFRGTLLYGKNTVYDELFRYRPAEVLLAPELYGHEAFLAEFGRRFPVMISEGSFDLEAAQSALEAQFGSLPQGLEAPALRRAAGALVRYALRSQDGSLPQVRNFVRYDPSLFMQIGESTLRTLEIYEPSSVGERSESRTLLGVLGLTRTAPGRRLLRAWLRHPLLEEAPLQARLDAVEALVRDGVLRAEVRKVLYRMHDLERLSSRLLAQRASARDLSALERSLSLLPELSALLQGFTPLASLCERLPNLSEAADRVRAALVSDPPLKLTEGGLIREGFDPDLDGLRHRAEEGRGWIAGLENTVRETTQIPTLKVGYNAVFGYYLEVTRPYYDSVPKDWRAVQTLKDRMRFTTPELKEQERKILQAESEAIKREYAVFLELREALAQYADEVRQAAQVLAELDVYAALAEAATEYGYTRPRFTQDGTLEIRGGRHAVVERSVSFIANDLSLSPSARLLILTGPNMSGKSTYLRQTALIALLAQIGSFVPAESATLPLFDRIYTRIGASDDIAGGRSTFMVEMEELATILQHATAQSLVLLDEIGRGTSTYDGLSLAWAACEHLHNLTKAYTLFATHYFELTALANHLSGARNFHVAAKEEAGGLVFYHQVLPGPASQSYGLEVARLAGVPHPILVRAQALLQALEAGRSDRTQEVLEELLSTDLTRLSPLEALLLLGRLQEKLQRVLPA